MAIRIVATPATMDKLKPGDLWSHHGPEYWDMAIKTHKWLMASLYVRNNAPFAPYMRDFPLYFIRIEGWEEEKEVNHDASNY